MEFLLDIHSIFRYVVILLILTTFLKALMGWLGNKEFTPTDKRLSAFTVMSFHIQLVLGFILYFMSPTVSLGLDNMGETMKDKVLRFWTVEHVIMMLIAVILVTIANSQAKRAKSSNVKFRRITILFFIAMVILFLAIPWPFSGVPRNWF